MMQEAVSALVGALAESLAPPQQQELRQKLQALWIQQLPPSAQSAAPGQLQSFAEQQGRRLARGDFASPEELIADLELLHWADLYLAHAAAAGASEGTKQVQALCQSQR